MAAKKTTKKPASPKKLTTRTSHSPKIEIEEESVSVSGVFAETNATSVRSKKWIKPALIAAAFVLFVAAILWRNKLLPGLVVAGTVDGQPVWRWNMEKRLVSRYGSQTLDDMVTEQIILNEAAKRKASVSPAEVNAKVADIEKSLNGQAKLSDLLAQQNMTVDDLKHQIELQLLLQKMTADNTQVTEAEINDYLSKNKDSLAATDEAGLKAEALQTLQSEKQNTAFKDLFNELKAKAKIQKYL